MNTLAKTVSFFVALTLSSQLMAFELKHSEGIVKLENTPQTIVSYDLAVIDSLNYLGITVAGMPNVHEREAFKKYTEIKPVGTMFEPDYFLLNNLKPELIFASRRTADKQNELNKVAPVAYYSVNNFQFLDDFRTNNINLGKAFAKEAEVEAKLAEIDSDLARLHKINAGQSAAFMMVFKNGNIINQVPGDLMGFAYEAFGLNSVLPARDPKVAIPPRPQPGSPEAIAAAERQAKQISDVAKANPDWLIIFDRQQMTSGEISADSTLKNHPELAQINAIKNNKIIYIDPAEWYLVVGGLNNFHGIIKKLIDRMQ
ncbi:MAG: ABC transporter substrate-binding protein [Alcaligenaceae bacterium]|nr:ABC transporter substrate-binding protein [Alcaligenaceae bacterium]